jgi:anti-sigma B factor antagonist
MPEKAAGSRLIVAVERRGDLVMVRCSGKLVSGVNDHLHREVSLAIPDCKRIVLDMEGLTHMDSSGIGTLVRLYVSCKSAGCVLELKNVGKPIRQLLGVTHLISVFAIVGENNIRMG